MSFLFSRLFPDHWNSLTFPGFTGEWSPGSTEKILVKHAN